MVGKEKTVRPKLLVDSLKSKPETAVKFIGKIGKKKRHLPLPAFEQLMKRIESRRAKGEKLGVLGVQNQAAEAELLKDIEQLEAITKLADHVFGDETVAESWLREPNVAMDDKPPIALLDTKDGFERVKNLLLRIQYGVLA